MAQQRRTGDGPPPGEDPTFDLTVPLLALGTIILVVGGLFSLRWFRLLP